MNDKKFNSLEHGGTEISQEVERKVAGHGRSETKKMDICLLWLWLYLSGLLRSTHVSALSVSHPGYLLPTQKSGLGSSVCFYKLLLKVDI